MAGEDLSITVLYLPQLLGLAMGLQTEELGLDLSGMTYAITGANSGLGLETMRVLALRGAHVIGIARTREKAEAACNSVTGDTTPLHLDLGVFGVGRL